MHVNGFRSSVAFWAGIGVLLSGCGGSSSSGGGGPVTGAGKFAQHNLVANTAAGGADVTDPNLVNAWGIAFSPAGPFWIANNGTGLVTLYNSTGATQPLVVTVPPAGAGVAPVTGQVYNGTGDFVIPGKGASLFIFDSEDGLITAWNPATNTSAITVADRSATGAVYKGLALAANGAANFLYAANFHSGAVDVFDKDFAFKSSFTDNSLPAGYAPFGISAIDGKLYVAFAKQDAAKKDEIAGAGNGYVDVFNPDGTLAKRLISGGALNAPWGIVKAPAGFGSIGGALLVGNFGDGWINAYNISTGAKIGPLNTAAGNPLVIQGLWALTFGNGGAAGSANTLYFTAGPNDESDGLFGSLSPSP